MTSPPHILVVEDDPLIRRAIADALRSEGYEATATGDGRRALDEIVAIPFDLALLDIVLPGADGWTILDAIKREQPDTPVIMLTAKGSEHDRIRGLKGGADDYLVKPFSLLELLARIEAVLRRCPGRPLHEPEIPLPRGVLDLKNWQVVLPDGTIVPLTGREYGLIRHVATHPGRVVTKEEILARVWNMNPDVTDTRSIEVTLNRLREKLGTVNAAAIVTVRGRGYTWYDKDA